MRVMLLVTDLEYGGTPLRLARLARRLPGAGVDVHIGCLAMAGPVAEELSVDGLPVFACDARHTRDWRAVHRLLDHVRRIRPDLIHATLTHSNAMARLAGQWCGVPVIGSTATIEVERRWHLWIEKLTAGFDAAHIVNSRAAAEHVVETFGLPERRVFIVPPSLDPYPKPLERASARATLGIPDREYLIAWVGRMDPVKRLPTIVDCARELAHEPMRFVLVGDGPQRAELEQMTRRAGLSDRVLFLGWRSNVATVLSAADVFLFPSVTEGMPNAVLEAMACGVAIVASDIPVLRELSADGRNFPIITPPDAHAFAGVIRDLCRDADRRRAYAAQSAAWAQQNLDPAATVQAVIRVYGQVLAERGP